MPAGAIAGAGLASAGAKAWGASQAADAQSSAATKAAKLENNAAQKAGNVVLQGANKTADWQKDNYQDQMGQITGVYGNTRGDLENTYNAAQTGLGQSLQPFIDRGLDYGNQLDSRIGALTGRYADWNPTQSQLESTPGYQFALQQGQKATQNSYAAKGLGSSAAAEKGIADYTTGLASQTYGQNFNVYQQLAENYYGANQQEYNMLSGVYNTGATAAGQLGQLSTSLAGNYMGDLGSLASNYNSTAAGYGANTQGQVGNTMMQGFSGYGNALIGGAQALAGGLTGAANANAAAYNAYGSAIGSGLTSAAGAYASGPMLNQMYNNPQSFAPGGYGGYSSNGGFSPASANPYSGVQSTNFGVNPAQSNWFGGTNPYSMGFGFGSQ